MTESMSIGNIVLDFSDFVFIPDCFCSVLRANVEMLSFGLIWFKQSIFSSQGKKKAKKYMIVT